MVPVFTGNRSISLAPSFAPAASPRARRSRSSRPPHRHAKPATEPTAHFGRLCAAPRLLSTRFEPVPRLRRFTTGSSRIPSDLARRTQPVWQYQAITALSALLPTHPGVSRVELRSAPTGPLRQPNEKVSHLLRFPAPHGAPAPRGAQGINHRSARCRASPHPRPECPPRCCPSLRHGPCSVGGARCRPAGGCTSRRSCDPPAHDVAATVRSTGREHLVSHHPAPGVRYPVVRDTVPTSARSAMVSHARPGPVCSVVLTDLDDLAWRCRQV